MFGLWSRFIYTVLCGKTEKVLVITKEYCNHANIKILHKSSIYFAIKSILVRSSLHENRYITLESWFSTSWKWFLKVTFFDTVFHLQRNFCNWFLLGQAIETKWYTFHTRCTVFIKNTIFLGNKKYHIKLKTNLVY